MTLLDAVYEYLKDELDEEIFVNHYPDKPDTIVSVIDLGGFPPDKYAITRKKKVEIKFRSNKYPDGVTLGNHIYDVFHAFENYSMGDFFIYSSYADTEVNYLYEDKKERKEFSLELAFQYIKK